MRQGFEHQHARHHRAVREMPLKEALVVGDVLECLDALTFLQRHDPIHEKERMAVREVSQDLMDVQFHDAPW
jgi:hypothetical protein